MARRDLEPSRYVAQRLKQQALRDRWNGAPGDFTRQFMRTIWGSVHPVVGIGFTANSTGQYERTSANEIGYWNTPAAAWDRIRNHPPVTTVLHRDGVASSEFGDAVADQCAIGLTDYLNGANEVVRIVPTALEPRAQTMWFVWISCMAYTAGAGGAASILNASRATNPTMLVQWLIERGTSAQAHPAIRAWQRILCAQFLAHAYASADLLPWFDGLPPTALETPLVQLSNQSLNRNALTAAQRQALQQGQGGWSGFSTAQKVGTVAGIAGGLAALATIGYIVITSGGSHGKKKRRS